jgi:hypothetical protein
MEVRSHERIKATWSHDGRRGTRHRRRPGRHLQRRCRAVRFFEHRIIDDAVRYANHDHPRSHDSESQLPGPGVKNGNAVERRPGGETLPEYGLRLERKLGLGIGI